MLKSAMFGFMMLGASQAMAANLIADGDFEQGATAFSSDYAAVPTTATGHTGLWDEGSYAVGGHAHDYHALLSPIADHTSGHGDYLIVNGATEPGRDAWRSGPLDLGPGTYSFSLWTTNLYDAAGPSGTPELALFAEGYGHELQLTSFDAPATSGAWHRSSFTMTIDRRLTGALALRDLNTARYGNDFGVDDITLAVAGTVAAVPEPASWALTIAGIGLIGGVMRAARRAGTRLAAVPAGG